MQLPDTVPVIREWEAFVPAGSFHTVPGAPEAVH